MATMYAVPATSHLRTDRRGRGAEDLGVVGLSGRAVWIVALIGRPAPSSGWWRGRR